MTDIAITAHALGKEYRLGLRRYGYDTLREGLVRAFRSRRDDGRAEAQILWALRDVSLTVRQGEVVGIVGHNGAGKSTLLKILSRITEPTEGYVDLRGRVGSLLEVGTGFHPELTGRENVYLNGSIIGMSRNEVRRRFDEIVAFAEIERFLDTPVKRYSSGMSVRLAFAVAAHLEPEILLVDEVLAVGDAAFQRKSLGKMGEVANEGRTVLFVSHNLAIIRALCPRAVLLDHGGVVADGPVDGVLGQYLRALERSASTDLVERTDRNPRGWQQTKVAAVEIRTPEVGEAGVAVSGAPATITIHLSEALPAIECQLTIVNSLAQPVTTLSSEDVAPGDAREHSGHTIECHIESLPLVPGRYRIDVMVTAQRQFQDGLEAAAFFDVEPGLLAGRPVSPPRTGAEGDVAVAHTWRLPGY
jgi:lipopolysaccharide transport system ATP-binding protein